MKISKRQLRRIIREATAAEMERWESDYRDPPVEYESEDIKYDHPSEKLKSTWSSDERDEPSLLDRFKSMLSDEEREKMDSYDHPSEELKKRWVSESSWGDRPSWEDDASHPDYDKYAGTEYDQGFDDRLNHLDPVLPEDEDYMQGWYDAGGELAAKPDEGIRRRGW